MITISSRRRWILAALAGLILTIGLTSDAGPAHADGLDDLCQTVPAPVRTGEYRKRPVPSTSSCPTFTPTSTGEPGTGVSAPVF